MSCGTLAPARSLFLSPTGLLPALADLSRPIRLGFASLIAGPQPQTTVVIWFGLFPFRSPLLRESMFLSFPPGTKMFQFPGFPPIRLFYSAYGTCALPQVSSLIRKSAGRWIFAPYRSLSQLVTSFVGSQCQGIRLMLLFA